MHACDAADALAPTSYLAPVTMDESRTLDPAKGPAGDSLSYAAAGVDISAGNALVDRIGPHVSRTRRAGVLGGIGGFGGLFEIPVERYRRPVMVSGADGVGTKLRLATTVGRHNTIGIDLVAMCANDILVCGAEPLWFLDYYASASLDVDVAEQVIAGIAEGCVRSDMALLGGETAEMPGHYAPGDYDLAGFAVGIVEHDEIIDGSKVSTGDLLVGISSSGPHSNGYSLIRKVLEREPADILDRPLEQVLESMAEDLAHSRPMGQADALAPDATLADALLQPTSLYVRPVRAVLGDAALGSAVHAMAHITGGGLTENLPRVLPQGLAPHYDEHALQRPPLFRWLQRSGSISDAEMRRTFNDGIGFVLVVAADQADAIVARLTSEGQQASVIGEIVASP